MPTDRLAYLNEIEAQQNAGQEAVAAQGTEATATASAIQQDPNAEPEEFDPIQVPGQEPILYSDALSKVLFPDTHTDKVTLLGKERTLTPLPIKYAKELYHLLKPIAKDFEKAIAKDQQGQIPEQEVLDMNDKAIEALTQVGKTLSLRYGWMDVSGAIENELLSVSELQELAVTQEGVNGVNDFLLGPLRICIRVMQIAEMIQRQFHSLLITPPSVRSSA